jgi:ribonucleoside-diphosphate reductase alpha chain
MRVLKRGSRGYEAVHFDKITARIGKLMQGLNPAVDPVRVAQQTIENLYDKISTSELDSISAKCAESHKLIHPDYSVLAARIFISNLHKNTPSFSECMKIVDRCDNRAFSKSHMNFILDNASELDAMIDDQADFKFDYFGCKTLEGNYFARIVVPVHVPSANLTPAHQPPGSPESYVADCAKTQEIIMDRPQYVIMRVAIAVNLPQSDTANYNHPTAREWLLKRIHKYYLCMSQMQFTHATPTLFNSCASRQQLNSCFLLGTGDSIEQIMKTLTNASLISKRAGGIGIWMHPIRSRDCRLGSTKGRSSGLPKQLKIYNEASRCWDQGGRRPGAFAIYLEPWHGDILKYLELKLSQGADTERARDLFYALWVPDLFMQRAEALTEVGRQWSLFSESTAPGLSDVYDGMMVCSACGYCDNPSWVEVIINHPIAGWGPVLGVPCNDHKYAPINVFTELYSLYERAGQAVAVVSARDVIDAVCTMQRESGTPYICHKDHINRMSNHQGIGTIKSSNLCTEIMEFSSESSYASCTLASISLKTFLKPCPSNPEQLDIDHAGLHKAVRKITRGLDQIIDVNEYPVKECVKNAHEYRPIGIGIQGLADVFAIMRIPFLSPAAAKIDLEIAETIYHAALSASCTIAQRFGSHVGFESSPAAKGMLHFDLWMQNNQYIAQSMAQPLINADLNPTSNRYDWDALRKNIIANGLRNSLHIALMPTVSTSQILGNNESFEPFSANIYTKNTFCGKFMVANNAMIRHLIEIGCWNDSIRRRVMNAEGSIQSINEIPPKFAKFT